MPTAGPRRPCDVPSMTSTSMTSTTSLSPVQPRQVEFSSMESLHRAHPPERGTAGPHYGCVGVGVGPANLSLASLLHGDPGLTSLFVEQSEDFGWHDGQQIPG